MESKASKVQRMLLDNNSDKKRFKMQKQVFFFFNKVMRIHWEVRSGRKQI